MSVVALCALIGGMVLFLESHQKAQLKKYLQKLPARIHGLQIELEETSKGSIGEFLKKNKKDMRKIVETLKYAQTASKKKSGELATKIGEAHDTSQKVVEYIEHIAKEDYKMNPENETELRAVLYENLQNISMVLSTEFPNATASKTWISSLLGSRKAKKNKRRHRKDFAI